VQWSKDGGEKVRMIKDCWDMEVDTNKFQLDTNK
jgi:hypothetical protein